MELVDGLVGGVGVLTGLVGEGAGLLGVRPRPRRPPWRGARPRAPCAAPCADGRRSSFLRARWASRSFARAAFSRSACLAAAAGDGALAALVALGLGLAVDLRGLLGLGLEVGDERQRGPVGVQAEAEAGLLVLGDEHAACGAGRRPPRRGRRRGAWRAAPARGRRRASRGGGLAAFATALAAARSAAVASRSPPASPGDGRLARLPQRDRRRRGRLDQVRLLARHLVQRPRRRRSAAAAWPPRPRRPCPPPPSAPWPARCAPP